METVQNYANLTPAQRSYVDFVASGGVIVNPDNEKMEKLSSEKLASVLGVHRNTFYEWRKLPNFWEIVTTRRNEMFSETRMSKVYNAVFAKALKGDVQAANLLMKQAGMLKADKQETQINGELKITFGDASH